MLVAWLFTYVCHAYPTHPFYLTHFSHFKPSCVTQHRHRLNNEHVTLFFIGISVPVVKPRICRSQYWPLLILLFQEFPLIVVFGAQQFPIIISYFVCGCTKECLVEDGLRQQYSRAREEDLWRPIVFIQPPLNFRLGYLFASRHQVRCPVYVLSVPILPNQCTWLQ